MRNRMFTAHFYAHLYANRAKNAAVRTKDKVIENKSELACIAVTSAVIGVAARASGFQAGYEFAQNN